MQPKPVTERMKASDFPQDLLNLFDKYVHGDIDRRAFLDGAQKYAVGGVTATMIWENLRPNYAWAQVCWPVRPTPPGSFPLFWWYTKTVV
jgi:hypothetical protein